MAGETEDDLLGVKLQNLVRLLCYVFFVVHLLRHAL